MNTQVRIPESTAATSPTPRRTTSRRRGIGRLTMLLIAPLMALLAVVGLTGAANASTSVISVVGPTATCTMNFNYQAEVDAQAYLLHQVGVTAHYQVDLLLAYNGAWHDVQQTGVNATTSNWAGAWFTPTNGYSWDGLPAKVRLWVWNNYGSGWKWYYYDSSVCTVP
jgi:hypothetical protein